MQYKQSAVVILSILLLFAPVVPISASSAAGQMFSEGNVTINGVLAPATTSAFSGDRIITQKDATTSLSFPGGNAVVLLQASSAALGLSSNRTAVTLQNGALSVLDKGNGIVIEAGGARIQAAANQTAAFDVLLRGNSLRVIARVGTARIETANRSAELTAGRELDATMAPPDPAAPAPSPAAASGLSGADIFLISVAAISGITGVVLGTIAVNQHNTCQLSPSQNTITC